MADEDLKWFSFYPREFADDENVKTMTNEQVGIYIRLLCHEWTEGSIPDDIAELSLLVHVPECEMEEKWKRISRCFVAGEPGRLINPRLEDERAVSIKRSRGSSLGGKVSAERRRSRKLRGGSGNAGPVPVQADSWDCEQAFDAVWNSYPSKGRVKRPLSEQYFVEKVRTSEDAAELLAAVAPGGKWARSDKWDRGFIMNLPEFLNQECWREEPEPAGGAVGGTVYTKWEPPK